MAEPEQIDEPDDAQVVQFEEPRRSERDRTLTEKGKEFHKEKTKGLLLRFDSIYDRWKALSKVAKSQKTRSCSRICSHKAVLKIMAEQEGHQEKLQRLEVEDKLIAADQEAAAVSRRLQAEKEETERKIERERKEAALLKQQEEESAARKRSVKDLKRELERLEELKRLNSARAKLQVYDEEHIAPLMECEIGLLIGYNCPQALMPREVVIGEENQPFAQRTDLGWSIVIPAHKPTVKLKSEVHYVCNTRIKEVVTPDDVIKVLESDFSERVGEEAVFSQEDLQFLNKLKDGIKHKPDGH
ncbi:hypothetical protein D4764_04G0015250 [Takifugu flavidus]|uniref:Uncharacterized protein n=1 Tax=Takifugu flavidus TaxID=433684 RepID=A0A5C6N807_9TELE|nr:hypothetical protein D4764_04G0015250 [Takifugu flavidus]